MSCKICGKSAYTESFHSIEVQEEFDTQRLSFVDKKTLAAVKSISEIDKKLSTEEQEK